LSGIDVFIAPHYWCCLAWGTKSGRFIQTQRANPTN